MVPFKVDEALEAIAAVGRSEAGHSIKASTITAASGDGMRIEGGLGAVFEADDIYTTAPIPREPGMIKFARLGSRPHWPGFAHTNGYMIAGLRDSLCVAARLSAEKFTYDFRLPAPGTPWRWVSEREMAVAGIELLEAHKLAHDSVVDLSRDIGMYVAALHEKGMLEAHLTGKTEWLPSAEIQHRVVLSGAINYWRTVPRERLKQCRRRPDTYGAGAAAKAQERQRDAAAAVRDAAASAVSHLTQAAADKANAPMIERDAPKPAALPATPADFGFTPAEFFAPGAQPERPAANPWHLRQAPWTHKLGGWRP